MSGEEHEWQLGRALHPTHKKTGQCPICYSEGYEDAEKSTEIAWSLLAEAAAFVEGWHNGWIDRAEAALKTHAENSLATAEAAVQAVESVPSAPQT